jgi:hypothetical protein
VLKKLSDARQKNTGLEETRSIPPRGNDYGGGITVPTGVERALSSLLEFTAVVS